MDWKERERGKEGERERWRNGERDGHVIAANDCEMWANIWLAKVRNAAGVIKIYTKLDWRRSRGEGGKGNNVGVKAVTANMSDKMTRWDRVVISI